MIDKKNLKKIIPDLFKLSDIETIEAGIIKSFLNQKNITPINNLLIKKILKKDSEKIIKYFLQNNLKLEFQDIEKIFELLISKEDKRINGAVYTPSFIVDYIINETINTSGKVCDCSCGSGAFLIGALKRIKKLTNQPIKSIIENHLFGCDILEDAIRRCKILLSLYSLINNEDSEIIKFNLIWGDSLKLDWKKQFPKIFKEKSGFDYVVGNPPYVRIQDLNINAKNSLYTNWESTRVGNYNLYFAFFELGIKNLNNEGKLGYITPNNFFTSLAGISLRKYFSKNKQITKILNFNHLKIFENASTYTCITFMEKKQQKDFFKYHNLKSVSYLDNLSQLTFSKYYYNWLNNKKWRLMNEEDYFNIQKIETAGTKLKDLYPIRVGIATLKDPIYFVEDYDNNFCKKTHKNKEYLIEKGITRKIIKISAIKMEQEIPNDKRRIIFPYIKKNEKYEIIDEEFLKKQFPLCYQYLLDKKEELSTRDKGKKDYPSWFAWGRAQGLNFEGERLYTRTFYHKPDFMMDTAKNHLFCNGYAIFCDNKNIKKIQKILNSKIMEYYIKKTSVEIEGNYQCYQKNFIERFNIPSLTEEDWNYLAREKDKNKLNNWLIEKYNLKDIS